MSNATKSDTDDTTITIPGLPDPGSMLDAQIEQAMKNLDALRPAVDAFRSWERYAGDLIAVKEGKTVTAHRSPRKSTSGAARAPRGSRAAEFLNVVKEAGAEGIRVVDAGAKMNMGANYLYRIAPELTEQGYLRKEGSRYFFVKDLTEGEAEPQGDDE